jgi:hypothetical protein
MLFMSPHGLTWSEAWSYTFENDLANCSSLDERSPSASHHSTTQRTFNQIGWLLTAAETTECKPIHNQTAAAFATLTSNWHGLISFTLLLQ